MFRWVLGSMLIALGGGQALSQASFDPNQIRCQTGISLAIQSLNKLWNGDKPNESEMSAYFYVLGVADTLFLDEPVPKKRIGKTIGGLAAFCQETDDFSFAKTAQKLSSSELYIRKNPTTGD